MTGDASDRTLFRSIADSFLAQEGVSLGKMLKAEALKVGGKSFAYPTDDAIVFKLPKAEVDALEADGRAKRLVVGKRALKEWAVVPASQRDLCLELAEKAYRFVADGVK